MDLQKFAIKSNWAEVSTTALSLWGFDKREADIVVDKVLKVVMARLSLMTMTYNKEKQRLEATLVVENANFHAGIYRNLNRIDDDDDYPDHFVMTTESELFYSIFQLSVQTTKFKGMLFLSQKASASNQKIKFLCQRLDFRPYMPKLDPVGSDEGSADAGVVRKVVYNPRQRSESKRIEFEEKLRIARVNMCLASIHSKRTEPGLPKTDG